MNKFIAIDVETANPDYASICQIGLAVFEDGRVVETWETLVDPEDYFDGWNVSIHGIDRSAVRGAPKFPQALKAIEDKLGANIVVHHTPFDRLSFDRAFKKYKIDPPSIQWLDSARVARRVWTQFSQKGYNLANLAEYCGVQFDHHDACEDARAAGEVMCKALVESGKPIEDWLILANKSIYSTGRNNSFAAAGNPEGALFGEKIVFTGALKIPRGKAAKLAAQAGCEVEDGVTKHTTILVVGDQDLARLAGQEKSAKHRKAEELLAKGQAIRIIQESDFIVLIAEATGEEIATGQIYVASVAESPALSPEPNIEAMTPPEIKQPKEKKPLPAMMVAILAVTGLFLILAAVIAIIGNSM
jgi:DNA polymerase-3 subunit epsilon